MLRLLICWPFPEHIINDLADVVQGFVVPEINYGQMSLEVERVAAGRAKTIQVPHMGGGVHNPATITKAIVEAVR
jgi:2-oxoglutarate ferredoxin oxidoreductase subunit alpha